MTLSLKKHPRLRGEYPLVQLQSLPVQETPPLARGIPKAIVPDASFSETPPLARGILRAVVRVLLLTRNTPACAGNTGYRDLLDMPIRKHPRLRGEYATCAHVFDES